MRMRIPIVFALYFLIIAHAGISQDIVAPLPQGEGYAVKKSPPTANSRWELKLVNQSYPQMGERTLISPASFYNRDIPEEVRKEEAEKMASQTTLQVGLPQQDAPETTDHSEYLIKRLIRSESQEEDREQISAFIEAYNRVLLNSPPDEPIEIVVDKAAWQYWFEQMSYWEEYVSKSVFKKKSYDSNMENLDFSSLDALKNSANALANQANAEAYRVIRSDYLRNIGFLNRLNQRQDYRADYRNWLEDQKALVVDFTHQWARRENQQEINIDGVLYMLSEQPLESVPRNAVNLVTPKLTPYDLLNADGTIKKPLE